MEKFEIYCTDEQTRKAIELGAPIIKNPYSPIIRYETCGWLVDDNKEFVYLIPTASQMIGWLEEKEEISDLHVFKPLIHWTFELYASNGDGKKNQPLYKSRQEATLAAIDAALEYLSESKVI